MPAPYSTDLRTRLLNWYNAGNGTLPAAARHFAVGPATASRWVARFKRTGEIEPRANAGGVEPMLTDADLASIRTIVEQNPSLTMVEIIAWFVDGGGETVSPSTMGRAVRSKLGFTRKKTHRGSTPSRRRA